MINEEKVIEQVLTAVQHVDLTATTVLIVKIAGAGQMEVSEYSSAINKHLDSVRKGMRHPLPVIVCNESFTWEAMHKDDLITILKTLTNSQ